MSQTYVYVMARKDERENREDGWKPTMSPWIGEFGDIGMYCPLDFWPV